MRSHPSSMIKFCLARAMACRRNADQAPDTDQLRFWREMEDGWILLAHNYQNERNNDSLSLRNSQGQERSARRAPEAMLIRSTRMVDAATPA